MTLAGGQKKITAELINYWAGRGPMDFYHSDVKSLNDKSAIQKAANSVSRKCTPTMFQRSNRNGKVVKRSWLCFSPANDQVYCFFSSRAKKAGRIDSELAHEMDRREHYWRSLLKRLISVLKFVCERGLALRGDNETIGSPNNGNYLGLLELLAEYDDFLGQHIKNLASRGSGHTNYLSPTVCEELVRLMGNRVLNEIISRLKLSKYHSVSLDSTADEGHVDQLTLIFRYMEQDRPVERFVKFLPN
ncbi:zinc finger MYM-type protein 1-like [Hydra vulgaris]|uniref:Zinc finger MYM-type protein 1-like n=1 Tax=Hydra vulgaris TaxID=6087 RepID=A0ABM4CA24_HYDVU